MFLPKKKVASGWSFAPDENGSSALNSSIGREKSVSVFLISMFLMKNIFYDDEKGLPSKPSDFDEKIIVGSSSGTSTLSAK